MKSLRLVLAVSFFAASMAPAVASAAVLTFDDVTTSDIAQITSYGGLDWTFSSVIKKSYAPGSGYEAGVVSGDYVAYNEAGLDATVTGDDFSFQGAYFTSAWTTPNGLTITGFLDGSTVGTVNATLTQAGPIWVGANFAQVDTLVFSTSDFHYGMDNFTYNEVQAPAAGVPELDGESAPMAVALLLGAGAVLVERRQTEQRRA